MLTIIILCALITFILRALPFLLFKGERKMPERLEKLGQILPGAIMAILVVYCLKDIPTKFQNSSIAMIAAVLITAITYKWKHNTFASIVLGTGSCMLLLQLI